MASSRLTVDDVLRQAERDEEDTWWLDDQHTLSHERHILSANPLCRWCAEDAEYYAQLQAERNQDRQSREEEERQRAFLGQPFLTPHDEAGQ